MPREYVIKKDAVFQSNRSQAVRLPKAVALPDDVKRVEIVVVGRIYGRPRLCKGKIAALAIPAAAVIYSASKCVARCDPGLDGRSANQLPITRHELGVRCAQRALLDPGLARLCHHLLFILATTSTSAGGIRNLSLRSRCPHCRAFPRMPIGSTEHKQRPNYASSFICNRDSRNICGATVP